MDKKLIIQNSYGNNTIDINPLEKGNCVLCNGKLIPKFPLLLFQSKSIFDEKLEKNVHHFLFESIVEINGYYLLNSARYIMTEENSKNIKEVFQEFHDEFVNKCKLLKELYNLNLNP